MGFNRISYSYDYESIPLINSSPSNTGNFDNISLEEKNARDD